MSHRKNIAWQLLLKLLEQAETPDCLEQLLKLFLTIDEREMLIRRFMLVEKLLVTEDTQRQIAKELELSISKITRGSNILKETPQDVKDRIINFIKKEKGGDET